MLEYNECNDREEHPKERSSQLRGILSPIARPLKDIMTSLFSKKVTGNFH